MSKCKVPSIGIITYHSALNYGSVLQALATQDTFEHLVGPTTIIDYRPSEQLRYYRLYRQHMGLKTFLADLSLLPLQKAREIRQHRFEKFIETYLHLTDKSFSDPRRASDYADSFDIFVSGSDQILNKHSNELERSPWNCMDPYLLTFTDRYKVTYASSPANMSDDEYLHILKDLQNFDLISTREQDSADKLSAMLGCRVSAVLDPTLLLTDQQWDKYASTRRICNDMPYMLYYSLDGPRKGLPKLRTAHDLARNNHLKLVVLTPYTPARTSGDMINAADAGPAEFLSLVKHAACVVTDSYHGTLFSVNYHRPFWSLSNGKGSSTRKDQILKKLGLGKRITPSIESISDQNIHDMDWMDSAILLAEYRRQSMKYIESISLLQKN